MLVSQQNQALPECGRLADEAIDLRQFIEFIEEEEPSKEKIERYITYLHKKYKQKTVKRKIASA